MPVSPMRRCGTVGCSGLTKERFCAKCKADGARVSRTPAERGYGYKWQQYSKGYLAQHPYCVDPFNRHGGQPVRSAVTDHIKAHKGNQQLFWDRKNHQALCMSCNSYKAATIEGGFGRINDGF
jgi:5-methylcytosine-specific restriction protein A